jgi:hypothetical protein
MQSIILGFYPSSASSSNRFYRRFHPNYCFVVARFPSPIRRWYSQLRKVQRFW